MPKYRKKIWAGDIYEVEEFYSPRTIGKKYERGRRENLTTEEQQKRNMAMARKGLTRMINANFSGKDYFVLFTFDKIVTYKEAYREFDNFRKRLGRYRKKNGFSALKYIMVIEMKERAHLHVILNQFEGMSMKDALTILQDVWGKGLVLIKHLYKNQPDNRLASYITKENNKKGAKRWSSSRNLVQPKVKLEVVEETKRKTSLRPPKGYTMILHTEEFFEEIGWVRYMKAIKEGGMDYGSFEEESEKRQS